MIFGRLFAFALIAALAPRQEVPVAGKTTDEIAAHRRLRGAIERGDVDAVEAALREGVDVNRPFLDRDLLLMLAGDKTVRRTPPLVEAVSAGDVRIVRLLLTAGADVDIAPEPQGDVALGVILATRAWDAEMLLAILEAGPDPRLVSWRPPEKATARGRGAYHLVPKIYTEWLQREWFKRGEPTDGSRTLLEAARRADVPGLRAALASGAPPDAQDDDGWTALLWACSAGSASKDAVGALLDAEADPNLASRWGWTPLMAAAHANEPHIVRALLERGADPQALEKTERVPVLHVAASYGSFDVVSSLLAAGADAGQKDAAFTGVLFCAEHNDTPDKERILELLRRELEQVPRPSLPEQIELATEGWGPGKMWAVDAAVKRGAAHGSLWVVNNSAPLAFDVVWVADGKEWRVGSFAAEQGSVRGFDYSGQVEGPVPASVEVVLRPSREVALRELKAWRIWGESISLGQVEVD